MDESKCADCGGKLGGRWGNRCYACTGRPRTGEIRKCKQCDQDFHVARWKLDDTARNQGAYCSRECKHAALRLNPVGTPRWGRRLLSEYGITYAQFEEMLERQGGKCAICGGGPNGPGVRLHVDHCHETNRVRGLLCHKCNTAIGLLDEDPVKFAAALKYLKN